MNLSDIRFPRQLEANETVETIRIDSYYYKKRLIFSAYVRRKYPLNITSKADIA